MFKIWQKVRIKSREQMEKEFWLDDDWDIEMEYTSFVNTMKHLCWRTAEIKWIDWKDIWLINRDNNEETIWFAYTTDMIEPERTPTPWEYVEVSDWYDRFGKLYLATLNGKYQCAHFISKEECSNWKPYEVTQWKLIRPCKLNKLIQ